MSKRLEYIERTPHISPAETPIRRYKTPHTMGNATPGGERGEIVKVGYQYSKEKACNKRDRYPTSKHIATKTIIGTTLFIRQLFLLATNTRFHLLHSANNLKQKTSIK